MTPRRLIAALLVWCAGLSVAQEPAHKSGIPPRFELRGAWLADADVLVDAREITTVGSYVVVSDQWADSVLHAFDAASGRHVRSFGYRGRLPGEVDAVATLDPVPGSRTAFRAFESGGKRIAIWDVLDASKGSGQAASVANAPGYLTTVKAAAGERLVALGFFPDGRIGLMDPGGKWIGTVGSMAPGRGETPPHVWQHAFQATFAPHPDRERFAIAFRHAGYLTILSLTDGAETEARVPYSFQPFLQVVERRGWLKFQVGPGLQYGYIDVCATADHIFALFSGRVVGDNMRIAHLARELHVFDWRGELVAMLGLDRDVLSVAVDERGTTIYAVTHGRGPKTVRRYALPPFLPAAMTGGRIASRP